MISFFMLGCDFCQNYSLLSESPSCFFMNAGISQSSFELSGARKASPLVKSGSTLEDEKPFCEAVNPHIVSLTHLVIKFSGCLFLIGSPRVFVLTVLILLEACSLNHVAMIVTFTSSSKESSNDIHQIIFASGSRIS